MFSANIALVAVSGSLDENSFASMCMESAEWWPLTTCGIYSLAYAQPQKSTVANKKTGAQTKKQFP